jgi:DNA-binding response OmpR family regulator
MNAKKRILISDCDAEVLIALERFLEDHGFDTTTACSTDEALRLALQKPFDLILAADHPPEMNCELLLRCLSASKTPVVAMENDLPRHPFAGPYLLSLGAKGIVHKWEHKEVQDAVTTLLVTSAPEAAKSAVAGTANLG